MVVGMKFGLFALILLAAGLAPPAVASEPPVREVVGRFLLTDVNGKAVTDQQFSGKFRLMTFGYTYCPDICPTVLNTLAETLDKLGPDRGKVATMFISVDPERDTPSHLRDYLTSFPGITGLTGTPEQVAAAAYNFKARYQKQPAANGDPAAYSVDHTASIYIMDRAGNFLARLPHGATSETVAARVRSYLYPGKADQ
jgi:protein SCO1/2